MLADLMFRKNEYDSAMFHFQQLLQYKAGMMFILNISNWHIYMSVEKIIFYLTLLNVLNLIAYYFISYVLKFKVFDFFYLAWDSVLSAYLTFPICLHWISMMNLIINILCKAVQIQLIITFLIEWGERFLTSTYA
jgi:hypothetical protein